MQFGQEQPLPRASRPLPQAEPPKLIHLEASLGSLQLEAAAVHPQQGVEEVPKKLSLRNRRGGRPACASRGEDQRVPGPPNSNLTKGVHQGMAGVFVSLATTRVSDRLSASLAVLRSLLQVSATQGPQSPPSQGPHRGATRDVVWAPTPGRSLGQGPRECGSRRTSEALGLTQLHPGFPFPETLSLNNTVAFGILPGHGL